MCKFSIMVPIYNTEKYLKRCLDSLVNQSYQDYEIILVNDGSTDNSLVIMVEYANKYQNIKIIDKQNTGVADTRNVCVKSASGEYIIFVDSDDYVESNLLDTVNKYLNEYPYDLVKFSYDKIDDDNKVQNVNDTLNFVDNGYNTFKKLCFSKIPFDMCPLYAYNRKFFVDNNFEFAEGHVHEDFGLLPLVIMKAKKVLVSNDILYHYYVSSESITRHDYNDKKIKMANDYLYHFDFLSTELDKMPDYDDTKKIFLSYLANALIEKARTLKGKPFDDYILELKKRNIFSLIIDDTFSRKIKKVLLKFSPKLYLKRSR